MSHRPLAAAYAELLEGLAEALRRDFAWPSPEAGFATFVFHKAGESGPIPVPHQLTWSVGDRLVHAPKLATLGYWLACGQGRGLHAEWLEGVDKLKRRDAFPSDRQSFVHRPIELLGVAVGIAGCAKERPDLLTWMTEVLDRLRKEPAPDQWSVGIRAAAHFVINANSMPPPIQLDGVTLEELALLRWVSRVLTDSTSVREIEVALLKRALLETPDGSELGKNAVLFQAIRSAVAETIESEVEQHWQVGRRQRDAEDLVVNLCRRFNVFAQQLRDRHGQRATIEIVDEYDVQDLIHGLLRLHFDDVRPEEVTPSLGGKSGRMDFLLKAERLVVETKMTRKGHDQKVIGDELIIDMKRYRSHPDYRTLVCFVYDPGGFCNTPAALENDLSGTEGDFRTIVIVCPRGM